MAFANTEADAGSNATNIIIIIITTTAVRGGDTWLINAAKQFITGMDVADAVLVVTRTGTGRDGRGLLTLFVVDTSAAGLEFRPIPMEIKAPGHQFSVFWLRSRCGHLDRRHPAGAAREADPRKKRPPVTGATRPLGDGP